MVPKVRLDLLDHTHKLGFMIDLRRLRALRELSERGTIAAAADALHLTPSAVSQQLAALEQEIGQPLLRPNGRTVRLTPAADAVLAHANEVFSELERMDATLASLAGGERGRVRIGSFATGIRAIVAPGIASLRRKEPGIEPAVLEVEAPEAFRLLALDELDIVISMGSDGAPQEGDSRFTRIELMRDALDLAVPAGHPVSDRAEVELSALAGEVFVAPPSGWACDQVFRSACSSAGFQPRVSHRSGDWHAVLALVAVGVGVACIPRLAQADPPPGVTILPIAGDPPARHLFIACRRGAERHPLLQSVIRELRAAAVGADGHRLQAVQ
jgi:DNA-binding transcriptional LysR family regulator